MTMINFYIHAIYFLVMNEYFLYNISNTCENIYFAYRIVFKREIF